MSLQKVMLSIADEMESYVREDKVLLEHITQWIRQIRLCVEASYKNEIDDNSIETEAPVDTRCQYCRLGVGDLVNDNDLVFSIEFDTYVHLSCITEALKKDPSDREALIFKSELLED